jgi:hypothetical protein
MAAAKKGSTKVPPTDSVVREWARRVEAEYRSAAITQHLTLWLIQMGASPDLIHSGLRIVKDELAHARLSHRTFVAAGGQSLPPITRETLALPRDESDALEISVVRTCVEVFCLGETVAVPLFKVLREECVVPSARTALDRILRDEVRHRDFGWTLLDYLFGQPYGATLRDVVKRELPRSLARVRSSYAPAGSERFTEMSADERAWGLMPVARYGQILQRTVERDYQPRFAQYQIDAKAAWDKALLEPRMGVGAPRKNARMG